MRCRKFGAVAQTVRTMFGREVTVHPLFSTKIVAPKFNVGKRDILRVCVIQQRSAE